MIDILADTRWIGPHGIGRFAREVLSRLEGVRELKSNTKPLDPLEPLRLPLLIRLRRPDVYFTPGFNPPLRSPVPFVFCLHDLIHLKVPAESSLARRVYYERVIKPAGKRAFRVLTVSKFSRRQILDWSGWDDGKVAVVGNGVGPEFTPDGDVQSCPYAYLLHVGNHKPHKNIDGLLRGFASSRIDSGIRLVLVGPEDVATRTLVQKLGLGERVVFAGQVADEELPGFYRGALGLVLPSHYEGFGLPPLEAMACGVPALCSDRTSLPEVAADAALVTPPDPEALAEGIFRLVNDLPLRADLRQRGLARARLFRWDDVAARVGRILLDAAGSMKS